MTAEHVTVLSLMSASDLHLTTPRLRLSPMTDDDIAALVRHWSDDQVRRYLWDDQPVTLDMVSAIVTTSDKDFQREGYGIWTARLLADEEDEARLIGMCGLRQVQGKGWLEILYSLKPRYWHMGLATEAAHHVLNFAFSALHQKRVIASADAGNQASEAVLIRLGFTPFTGGQTDDRSYWSITRDQVLAMSELPPGNAELGMDWRGGLGL